MTELFRAWRGGERSSFSLIAELLGRFGGGGKAEGARFAGGFASGFGLGGRVWL